MLLSADPGARRRAVAAMAKTLYKGGSVPPIGGTCSLFC